MFRGETIHDYYRQAEARVGQEISGRTDEDILGLDVTEYADYLYEKYALAPVERDPAREIVTELDRERREFTDHFGDRRQGEVKIARIEYPIILHHATEKVLKLLPNTQTSILPKFELRGDIVIMRAELSFLYGFGETPTGRDEIGSAVGNFETWLQYRNNDVGQLNPQFRINIENMIRSRKEHVAKTRADFEAMIKQVGFPIKLKPPEQSKMVTLPVRKAIQPILRPPTPKRPEEYVLKKEDVLSVVELIQRWGRSLEATPQSVAGLDEEDIRALLLAQLNGVVDGGATGEAFSKLGKSDIHLNLPRGEILVGECKVWSGAKAYTDAIDQLFRYLTWRQNFGIMIAFVRNKDFTHVLAEAAEAIQQHATFRPPFQKIIESHFATQHNFPDDPRRSVEVHHLFFHFPPVVKA